jgi:cbb3-type cytochrome oxidase subunit 3
VVNTGGRALDLAGSLMLSEGPGGSSVGPVAADLISTIGPGGRAPVTVMLDPDLPAGPWRAVMTVEGSGIVRTAEAVITFPEPGENPAVTEVDQGGGVPWRLLLLALLLLLLIALILFLIWRRRRRNEAKDAGVEG